MAIIINSRRVFRPYFTYMTCFLWSFVAIVYVILVMAINDSGGLNVFQGMVDHYGGFII